MLRLLPSIAAAILLGASSLAASAAPIPYGNAGEENPVRYMFTATGGDVVATFLGTGAAYDERIGIVGLTPNTGYMSGELENHQTTAGQSYNFGSVAKGTVLTLFLNVQQSEQTFYSDASLNSDRTNHIYATDYSASAIAPAGVYVGFEDLSSNRALAPAQGYTTDYNYTDEQFVFSGVAVSAVPLPPGLPLFGAGLLGLAGLGVAAKRRAARAG